MRKRRTSGEIALMVTLSFSAQATCSDSFLTSTATSPAAWAVPDASSASGRSRARRRADNVVVIGSASQKGVDIARVRLVRQLADIAGHRRAGNRLGEDQGLALAQRDIEAIGPERGEAS